jgi:hypothetical protein
MKFKYKYFVEIETELELPILGYDVEKAAYNLTKEDIDYLLETSITHTSSDHLHMIKDNLYLVKKYSKIEKIQ